MSGRHVALVLLAVLVLGWALVPLARGVLLVRRGLPSDVVIGTTEGRLEHVTFVAEDGIVLDGLYLQHDDDRDTVILVHGFKNTRADMLGYATFLYHAGHDVLSYDSRGCGESGGTFGVGATEDRDVRGAVNFVVGRRGARARVAVLGVSLGAGAALLAAARDPRIGAVVADSAWADERVQLERMNSVSIGPLRIPLLPYEPIVVDALIGGRLEDARPRDEIAQIRPRAVLLIHSADDENATTPLDEAREMFMAAGEPKEMWVAPRGGHAGAFSALPDEYIQRVTDFLARAFR